MPHRVGQVPADEGVDLAVEGGREQQPLAAGWHAVQQPGDGGQEAHVGHVVGLVEDGDVDGGQRVGTLAHQVLQPPGVATTTSMPRRSAWTCRWADTPP